MHCSILNKVNCILCLWPLQLILFPLWSSFPPTLLTCQASSTVVFDLLYFYVCAHGLLYRTPVLSVGDEGACISTSILVLSVKLGAFYIECTYNYKFVWARDSPCSGALCNRNKDWLMLWLPAVHDRAKIEASRNIYHLEARPVPSSVSIMSSLSSTFTAIFHNFTPLPGQVHSYFLSSFVFLFPSLLSFVCHPLAHDSACLFPSKSLMSLYQKLDQLNTTVNSHWVCHIEVRMFYPTIHTQFPLRPGSPGSPGRPLWPYAWTERHGDQHCASMYLQGLMKIWLPLDQKFPVDLAVHAGIYMRLCLSSHWGQSLHVLHTIESKGKVNSNKGPWS